MSAPAALLYLNAAALLFKLMSKPSANANGLAINKNTVIMRRNIMTTPYTKLILNPSTALNEYDTYTGKVTKNSQNETHAKLTACDTNLSKTAKPHSSTP